MGSHFNALLFTILALGATTFSQTTAQTPDPATIIPFLQDTTVVLTVGKKNMTWEDFKPSVAQITQRFAKRGNSPQSIQRHLRITLQKCAQRGIFLQEFDAMGLTVTQQDRLNYERQLEKALKDKQAKITKIDYINTFNKQGSNLAHLSYGDALKIMKFDEVTSQTIAVSPDQMLMAKRYFTAVNEALNQQNLARRSILLEEVEKPENRTAKGFEKMVKQLSEGVEAKWGGELKYDFTREELAAICYLEDFKFKVGEMTSVCETNAAYRILRVLREVPQKDGSEPKLRVAQILVGKIAPHDTSDAALKQVLIKQLKEKLIAELTHKLAGKYPVSSLFFPTGIWDAQAPNQTGK